MINNISKWLRDRYQIDALLYFTREKTVPMHKGTVWYYFGGIALFLFMVQVMTGLLLLFYYRVGPDASFESMQFIVAKVRFGWLLRNVHSWGANLMVLSVVIHMVSTFYERSYRKPRELTWITGILLLFMAVSFGFSGYLLPWNELAFFATKVGTDSARAVPFIGDFLLNLMRGGSDVTGITLSRFFGLHVAVLPPLFTILLAVHLFFVQSQGMSTPLEKKGKPAPKKTIPFFPNFALRDAVIWLFVLNILIVLSVLFPWELGQKADPFSPAPSGIKPEWYFLFIFQLLKFLPAHIGPFEGELVGMGILGLGAVITMLVPFLDRAASRGERSRLWDVLGFIALTFVAVFTVLGYLLD